MSQDIQNPVWSDRWEDPDRVLKRDPEDEEEEDEENDEEDEEGDDEDEGYSE